VTAASARQAYEAGRYDAALAAAEAGLAAGDDPELRKIKALSLIRLGRGAEADEILGELMTAAPDPAFMGELAAAMAGER
jgi:Flp pilus assembly protein TadD